MQLALLLSAIGCAAYQSARRGDAAMAAGDPETAVSEYGLALQEDPKNQGYKQKLLTARRSRANLWLTQARGLRQRGELQAALARCVDILSDLPDDAPALALSRELRAEYAVAEEKLKSALDALAIRDEPSAVAARLRELLPLVPSFPQLPAIIKRADDMQESNQRTQLGAQHLEKREFLPAIQRAKEALALDATNGDAKRLLEAAHEGYAAALAQRAEAEEKAQRYSAAVTHFELAAGLLAHKPESDRQPLVVRARILRQAMARKSVEAGRAMLTAQPGTAWAHYQAASALAPGSATERPNLEPLVRLTVATVVESPPHLATRLRPGLEQLLARYGGQGRVDPQPLGSGSGQPVALLRLQVEDTIESRSDGAVRRSERYVQRIDIVENPDYVRLIERAAQLRRELPSLARRSHAATQQNQLRRELEERESAAARTARENDNEAYRLRQELANLDGQIESLVSRIAQAPAQDRVSLRERLVQRRAQRQPLSRELAQAERQRDRAKAELDGLRARSSGLGSVYEIEDSAQRLRRELESTRSELSDAEEKLQRTSRTTEVPVRADYEWVDRYILRSGKMHGDVALLDAASRRPLVQAPLSQERAWRDFVRAEARVPGAPDLYIAPHRTRFPSDDEIRDLLVEDVLKEVGEKLDAPLRNHCDRFAQAARVAQPGARLNLFGLIAYCAAQVSDAAMLGEARRELVRATGYDFKINQASLEHFDGQPLPLSSGAERKPSSYSPR